MPNQWKSENRDRVAAHNAKYYAANKAKSAAAMVKWRAENRDRQAATKKRYYEANKPQFFESARVRKARTRNRPVWLKAHREALEALYIEAKRLTVETGTLHHVDHIIPLRGKTVCGLHVPWNLEVIPASENWSKGSKFILRRGLATLLEESAQRSAA